MPNLEFSQTLDFMPDKWPLRFRHLKWNGSTPSDSIVEEHITNLQQVLVEYTLEFPIAPCSLVHDYLIM